VHWTDTESILPPVGLQGPRQVRDPGAQFDTAHRLGPPDLCIIAVPPWLTCTITPPPAPAWTAKMQHRQTRWSTGPGQTAPVDHCVCLFCRSTGAVLPTYMLMPRVLEQGFGDQGLSGAEGSV